MKVKYPREADLETICRSLAISLGIPQSPPNDACSFLLSDQSPARRTQSGLINEPEDVCLRVQDGRRIGKAQSEAHERGPGTVQRGTCGKAVMDGSHANRWAKIRAGRCQKRQHGGHPKPTENKGLGSLSVSERRPA